MKITVTKDDIAKGMRCSFRHCPLALAIQRATGDDTASVGSKIKVRGRKFNHTESTKRFVGDFDWECPVKPFSFTLPIPAKTPLTAERDSE